LENSEDLSGGIIFPAAILPRTYWKTESPMATLLVKHRVANFDKWKSVFDRLERLREKHGIIGHSVHRDATDPNVVVIVNRVRDMAEAKGYGASPELHAAMAEAGVQGAPEISFLNDVEELRVG